MICGINTASTYVYLMRSLSGSVAKPGKPLAVDTGATKIWAMLPRSLEQRLARLYRATQSPRRDRATGMSLALTCDSACSVGGSAVHCCLSQNILGWALSLNALNGIGCHRPGQQRSGCAHGDRQLDRRNAWRRRRQDDVTRQRSL